MPIPSCGACTFNPDVERLRESTPTASRRAGRFAAAILGLLVAVVAPVVAADYPLEIIELRSRPPEDLVPVLAPLAGADGTLAAANNALFVRASPERLADIRRALAELDRPPRSLLIQARQAGRGNGSGAGARARIDERIGDSGTSGRIRAGPPTGHPLGGGGSGAQVWAGQESRSRDLVQEVRALDGHPAFIAIGRERPVPYREVETGPWGRTVREGLTYRSAESGLYVLPRVIGERVVLEVSTRAEDLRAGGSSRSDRVASRIEGRLGDWIALGSGADSERSAGGGLLFGDRGREETSFSVEVRVLPAPD